MRQQLSNPIGEQLINIEKILTLPLPQYLIEDARIQPLDGKIRKKFTSLSKSPVTHTTIYDPTIFRWKFGDEADPTIYTETTDRITYHTYDRPGTYLVQHQACNFCTCSDWNLCYQSISVEVKPPIPTWLLAGGLFAFLLLPREKCNQINNKEQCLKQCCQWSDKYKQCFRPNEEECYKVAEANAKALSQKASCKWREKGRVCYIKPKLKVKRK